ncbi:hypothetical protein HELRODRAFT_178718 [Helobdella robusta]|uniref:Uncharacterized protein n=1 Tax=Helobdella robusta TaxID=6412 RepID=T1FDM4_HELRO|nr:hypothetical protein HELRODRAFT_178718 [Helobdella robusta]ESN96918.1 hypothetical protein HELRODRAFT_178718 [Helobdella robusta]
MDVSIAIYLDCKSVNDPNDPKKVCFKDSVYKIFLDTVHDYVPDLDKAGGHGHIVQIDESCISSAKRSRKQNARIDMQTKDALLMEVERRDAGTLLLLIQHHVLPTGQNVNNDDTIGGIGVQISDLNRLTGTKKNVINLDALNLEKDDEIKANSSGNSKKGNVSNLILTIKTILSNKIESKLPQYADHNLFKISSLKKAKFESILDKKLKKLELFIEKKIFRKMVSNAANNNSPKVVQDKETNKGERKQRSDCKIHEYNKEAYPHKLTGKENKGVEQHDYLQLPKRSR